MKKIATPIILFLLIAIGGILIWQFSPSLFSPSQIPSSPIDETTDWKIYRNEEYEYEIEYSNDWDTTKCFGSIIFAPQDVINSLEQDECAVGGGKEFTLTINYRTKEQYEGIILPNRKTDENKIVALESAMVDGIESKHYTTEYLKNFAGSNIEKGDIFIDVLVPYEDGYLEITLLDNQYLEIYNQMISSFRFID